jgi:hypothetical protein
VDHLTSTATGHRPPDAAEAKAWSAGADREVRGGVEAGIAAYVGDHYRWVAVAKQVAVAVWQCVGWTGCVIASSLIGDKLKIGALWGFFFCA